MKSLELAAPGQSLRLLCLGAHSDDIEIGAGGTVLALLERGVSLEVDWCVLSGGGTPREKEARDAAADFLTGAKRADVQVLSFKDGLFPEQGEQIKTWFESLKSLPAPDLILTHRRNDAHQDHRTVNRLTWNTFRDYLVLEYEIPKWDGDTGQPNVYVPMSSAVMQRKCDLLMHHFGTQRSKQWFDEDTFRGLARLRGMECRAADRFAEGFYGHKISLI